VIITNAPDQLAHWRDSNTLTRSAFSVHGGVNLTDPLNLAWVHRDVAEAALAAGALSMGVSVKWAHALVAGWAQSRVAPQPSTERCGCARRSDRAQWSMSCSRGLFYGPCAAVQMVIAHVTKARASADLRTECFVNQASTSLSIIWSACAC